MAEEAEEDLDADATMSKSQSHDGAKDLCKAKQNNRLRRKIRATFPLLFVKRFQRSLPLDEEAPETVPEADYENITATEIQTSCDTSFKKTPTDAQNNSEQSEYLTAVKTVSPPKTRLRIPDTLKEKLLNWDVTPEETPVNTDAKTPQQLKDQVPTEADKPHRADSAPDGKKPPQSRTSSHSTFQLIANAFRRKFSMTDSSSSSNAAFATRPKRDGPHKRRPMSEGAFSFSSLFGAAGPEPSREEENTRAGGERDARWASVGGSDPWGAGRDLPSLLQQVSLRGRRDSGGGVFSDDMGSLPRSRRLDLFSSLRLRKREASQGEGKDHEAQREIRTILTKLRNKASSQQNLDAPSSSSSDDDNENLPFSQKLSAEGRRRRRQEKIVAQQTKREQLKRLHRAQVIQRQLEEVGEKQRDLEERGVTVEKIIRGETESSADGGDDDEARLYQSWFRLVLEKNRLARYESELMIFAQELELEDTQSRLQQDLRRRMATEDTTKSASELRDEQCVLSEIMRTVERRDALVAALEEQRLRERAEDRDLESLVLSRGYEFHWAPAAEAADDSWGAGGEAGV